MISSALDLPDDLEYVSDELPGLRRRKTASGFRYLDSEGNPIRNERQIERIKRLAIPPAWTDVWISPKANGHLQATGRDARGRKQYRYHARWREVRDQAKYERTQDFAAALPALRKRVERDLGTPGLTRDKVLATVVRLLDLTLVRVGNEEYARSNRSFGMTTLRKRHVQLAGSGIRIEFKGKGGKQHCVSVSDRRVARIVGRCQELPGQLLFQYLDEAGERRQVTSNDVNDYIREATAGDFTAKDVRTWAGTVVAANALLEVSDGDEESEAQLKRDVVQAVELVAEELGNTPAIARKCYIHPAVLDAYLTGSLKPVMQDAARTRKRSKWLNREEATVAGALDKLQRRR